MIDGKLVRIRALRASDLDAHLRWRNDPEVVHWAAGGDPHYGPITRESLERFHDARLRQDPRVEASFTVEDLADGRPIGTADYRDIDPFAGEATVGIVIGERSHWGGGYGSEALRLLLKHLFGACRVRRVELDTWSGNERAMRAFRGAGFVEEGRRRSAVRVGDQWYDRVVYGLLYEEWAERRRGH
ncbi:GNAT family protein [Streptomyces castrisilvae]|uniref:GNAT family protein n=1 Tax=Streptomyces castrisilvae TaxID=3033811 RepID=A0ABY9HLS5_9ACTN|nr:GNAT family protein [Streptomyces sp. Mut1]WLQ35379.1 GNAT family protein [Streptomyces sp. Mut1]